MNETEFLTFVRGTGMQISVSVFLVGIIYRLVQNISLGRKENLAEPRGSEWGPGAKTIWRRSFFHPGMTYRGYFTLISGYTFHIAFLVTLFFTTQHILWFRSVTGMSWPALPSILITILAVLGIGALVAVLVDRFVDPVKRMLSDYQDYLSWLLTTLPLVTGFMLFNKLGLPYKSLLAFHILSFQLLLIATPFTKLSHMVTLFAARWYNGAIAGYKGVQS
jgi:nitrate reductase gamma subunit